MSQYLYNLLQSQALSDSEIEVLQRFRNSIQNQLSALPGSPRFYYAGSYGKKTMIRAHYDLDIVVYWPLNTSYAIKDIYEAVGLVLKRNWLVVRSKTVSWELPFESGFHIDVVPGRALDAQFFEANLYRTDTTTTLKTSLKKHIDTIRSSQCIPIIRLMKLWRKKRNVPFKKSFLLELMTVEACKNIKKDDYQVCVINTFKYIKDNIMDCQLKDPANSNNCLADDLCNESRLQIKEEAQKALNANYWNHIFE